MIQKQTRNRGVILSNQGYKKLEDAIHNSKKTDIHCKLYTLEELKYTTNLSTGTIRKILKNEVVDKSSIRIFFQAFGLDLQLNDYITFQQTLSSQPSSNSCHDWGIAEDIADFSDREEELATLTRWIEQDKSPLVFLYGMGGVGKTYLALKLAHTIADQYDFVIWRSLVHAPSTENIIKELVSFFSRGKHQHSSLRELLFYLRKYKCLVILDGLEIIFEENITHSGIFKTENIKFNRENKRKKYDQLLRTFVDTNHQSCLILTSRFKHNNINILEAKKGKKFSLNVLACPLLGLRTIENKKLKGSLQDKQLLSEKYDHNPVLLTMIASYIHNLFNDKIECFLSQNMVFVAEVGSFFDEHFSHLNLLEKNILFWLQKKN
jgi:DNA replication protein DnaC